MCVQAGVRPTWLHGSSETYSGRPRASSTLAQRVGFGVRLARAMVVALADDASVAHDDGADRRIRRGVADSARGEFVGALEKEPVERR